MGPLIIGALEKRAPGLIKIIFPCPEGLNLAKRIIISWGPRPQTPSLDLLLLGLGNRKKVGA